jgi:hypothetical protein
LKCNYRCRERRTNNGHALQKVFSGNVFAHVEIVTLLKVNHEKRRFSY